MCGKAIANQDNTKATKKDPWMDMVTSKAKKNPNLTKRPKLGIKLQE